MDSKRTSIVVISVKTFLLGILDKLLIHLREKCLELVLLLVSTKLLKIICNKAAQITICIVIAITLLLHDIGYVHSLHRERCNVRNELFVSKH